VLDVCYKTNQLMPYIAQLAVCSETNTKHMITVNVECTFVE